MKNLKFELLKLIRNRFIVLVSLALILANALAAFSLCNTEQDAPSERYAAGIEYLIKDAERRYGIEVDKDGFSARYYKSIIDKYSALETDKETQTVKGYGQYLSYIYIDLFLFVCCAFAAAFTFRREKETGEMPTLYAAKNGRGRYAVTKLAACTITVIAFVILFCLSAFLGIWAKNGFALFEGGGARLQDIKAFIYAPYEIKTLSAVFVSALYKIPACLALATFAGGVSYLFNSGMLSLVFSSLFMFLSYRLNVRNYINKNAFFRNCNLFAATRASYIFGELRCINIFGHAVPAYVVNIVLPLLLFIAFSALFYIMHVKRAAVSVKIKLPKIKSKRKIKPAKPRGLFAYELQKIIKSRVTTATLILLLAAKTVVSILGVRAFPYEERVYKKYCERWEGYITEEVQADIRAEQKRLADGYRAYSALSFGGGDVSDIEDPAAEADYFIANNDGFRFFYTKYMRLIQLKEEQNIDAPIVYEGGYDRFFSSGSDIFLILFIVCVVSYLSTYDSVNKTVDIVKTTLHGGKKLTRIKLFVILSVSALVWAVFTLMTFISIDAVYGMSCFDFPVYSVQGYEVCGAVPLGAYVALIFALRFFGAALLVIFCMGSSSLIKNPITSMAVSASVYIIPAFMLKDPESLTRRCIDPALLLDGSGFMQLFSSPGAVAVSILICVVIPCILFIPFIRKVIKWNFR